MQSKNKTAKIHKKGVPQTYGWKTVPWLNLSGVWLEKAGFDIGDSIAIEVAPNKIMITVAEKAPKPPKLDYSFDIDEEL
ncbi:MAG TPA: SymE family type I addiction module toxin [Chitinophaga sp.]|uniref:SymE family type I addiction module toxin n=1 Tax=Chitinophaga sp. TaxID=1869181 RepID=UPI002BA02CC1|nr:SymE family type I addiction module toxin [Chitinophaga sp.]HVI46354.1 SymE family type I addiction module toxin [Chitinophaga sp.]